MGCRGTQLVPRVSRIPRIPSAPLTYPHLADMQHRGRMQPRLRALVDQFAQNPATAGKAMRDLLESDSNEFTIHALELVKTVPVSPGSNYILTLLLRDPSILEKFDPRFDVRIIEKITRTATPADQLAPAPPEPILHLISPFSNANRALPF